MKIFDGLELIKKNRAKLNDNVAPDYCLSNSVLAPGIVAEINTSTELLYSPQQDQCRSHLIGLIESTAKGDNEAFARLYRLTSSNLYAVALRILKQESFAQDCLQESFVSAWRHAGSYQSKKALPMTWLTTIVRNRAIDILRRQPKYELTIEQADEGRYVDDHVSADIDSAAIEKCLDELKSTQRDCLVHAYYMGMTHAELADHLRLPIGTVKTWIRRGLKQLRQCLK